MTLWGVLTGANREKGKIVNDDSPEIVINDYMMRIKKKAKNEKRIYDHMGEVKTKNTMFFTI